uniref:Uncharacterized protein n=1 Tax=Oryza rufipogon TaxID=4529 RepID=A0A0E0NZY9_ORYRU
MRRNRSKLLGAINGFYAAALDRLPVEAMPALLPRLLKAGLCVGFLDPVSNIVVNTITYKKRVPVVAGGDPDGKSAAIPTRRRRRKALSRIVADTSNVGGCGPSHRLLRDMGVAARSLQALVAFLTNYFPYLRTCEALEYLRLADADLSVAVRLIEQDRSSDAFSFASLTTETALTCAAIAGWHPNPKSLVERLYSIASQIGEASNLLSMEGCLSCRAVKNISRLVKHQQQEPVDLVGATFLPRSLEIKEKQPPFVRMKSLKSILLDKIYGLYLDVIACLPMDGLRMRYHRGLLKAGHCYGPFENPVHNIVLNTVWYEIMFPPQEEVSVQMICSRSLVRVACRSLNALVAYLRACFCTISEQQAMRYLFLTGANLWGAVEMARQECHAERNMLGLDLACMVAATAAHHPNPDALVKFFMSTFSMKPLPLQTDPFMFQTGGILNVPLLVHNLMRFCPSSCGSVQTVPVLSERASMTLSCIQEEFKAEQSFICGKVNDALKKYNQRTRLIILCLADIMDLDIAGIDPNLSILTSTFWRAQEICILLRQSPYFFFAECCNKEGVIDELTCCPVMGHPGRCYHCECEGAKIVHPDLEKYNGRTDFLEMARDKSSGTTTEDVISRCEYLHDAVDICEEDCVCFDASRDVECAEFLNSRAANKIRLE